MGFFVPRRLLAGRWALTPPFHPYLAEARRYVFCDTFRRAGLSAVAPARSTRHAAWRCSDFPLLREATAIIRHRQVEDTAAAVLGKSELLGQSLRFQPMPARDEFLQKVRAALDGETFVKLTLSQPRLAGSDLRNIYGRIVELKEGRRVSLVYRYQRRDVTKNVTFPDSLTELSAILGTEWERAQLFTTTGDWRLRCREDGEGTLKPARPAFAVAPAPAHDRKKDYLIGDSARPWLQALGVTNPAGAPKPGMADKLRQIQRFVELLGHLLDDSPLAAKKELRVADMGAGKGYLTFATAEYLRKRGVRAEIIGVELREELVERTNRIAWQSGMEGLRFETGEIGKWQPSGGLDLLIALHACDTATDDALHQGISASASLLVTAPCCHKEVRAQLQSPALLHDVLRHGILAEREAEILTDGIRASLLEIHGYSAKVFEFISPEHTSKNLMLAAHRADKASDPAPIRERLRAVMAQYGIKRQRLAELLGERAVLENA
jgi:hypothetical protein